MPSNPNPAPDPGSARFAIGIRIAVRALALWAWVWLSGAAQAEWARLKEGSIVKVRAKRGDEVAFTRSDGSTGTVKRGQIDGFLQPVAAVRIVDEAMRKIGNPEYHNEVRSRLKKIGMAAVPQLLVHLRDRDLNKRRAAAAALQMVWSREAQEPVAALLQDADGYLRQMALRLVQGHFPAEDRLRYLTPLADPTIDPELAGPALATVLGAAPDPARMLAALENPALWRFLHPLLPRYQSRAFIPASRRLLREGSPGEKTGALVALIYQMDGARETRATIAGLLKAESPDLRELAAEYLRWHGTREEVPALETAARAETDLHARASIVAAIDTAVNRSMQWTAEAAANATSPSDAKVSWPDNEAEIYREGIRRLSRESGLTSRRRVLDQLARAAPVEPVFEYVETWKLRPDPRNGPRLDLLGLAFAGVTTADREAARRAAFASPAGAASEPPDIPRAAFLSPPVRDYFDPGRNSFGLLIGPGSGPFSNSHHVGDDVSFGRQQRTVVAIGDGLVRRAEPGLPSWGGLVIIEHRDAHGTVFCSLYGHLGPLIQVMPGERVRRGDKLGTLGRDHVFATGGYRSHLHFGIHRGTFENDGRPWIGGYLGPERFADETGHRWADPQAFIRSRLDRPQDPAAR